VRALTRTVVFWPSGSDQSAHRREHRNAAFAAGILRVGQCQFEFPAGVRDREAHRGVHGDNVGRHFPGFEHRGAAEFVEQRRLARENRVGRGFDQGFKPLQIQRGDGDGRFFGHGSSHRYLKKKLAAGAARKKPRPLRAAVLEVFIP